MSVQTCKKIVTSSSGTSVCIIYMVKVVMLKSHNTIYDIIIDNLYVIDNLYYDTQWNPFLLYLYGSLNGLKRPSINSKWPI